MAPGWLSLALACPVSSADAGGPQGCQWEAVSIGCRRTCRCTQNKMLVNLRGVCMCIEFIYNVHYIYDICVIQWLGWDTGCGHRKLREDWMGKSLRMISFFLNFCNVSMRVVFGC
jgi:hypothetical protein